MSAFDELLQKSKRWEAKVGFDASDNSKQESAKRTFRSKLAPDLVEKETSRADKIVNDNADYADMEDGKTLRGSKTAKDSFRTNTKFTTPANPARLPKSMNKSEDKKKAVPGFGSSTARVAGDRQFAMQAARDRASKIRETNSGFNKPAAPISAPAKPAPRYTYFKSLDPSMWHVADKTNPAATPAQKQNARARRNVMFTSQGSTPHVSDGIVDYNTKLKQRGVKKTTARMKNDGVEKLREPSPTEGLYTSGHTHGAKNLPKSMEQSTMNKSVFDDLVKAAAAPAFDMEAFDRDNPVVGIDHDFAPLNEVDKKTRSAAGFGRSKKAPSMGAQEEKMKSVSKKVKKGTAPFDMEAFDRENPVAGISDHEPLSAVDKKTRSAAGFGQSKRKPGLGFQEGDEKSIGKKTRKSLQWYRNMVKANKFERMTGMKDAQKEARRAANFRGDMNVNKMSGADVAVDINAKRPVPPSGKGQKKVTLGSAAKHKEYMGMFNNKPKPLPKSMAKANADSIVNDNAKWKPFIDDEKGKTNRQNAQKLVHRANVAAASKKPAANAARLPKSMTKKSLSLIVEVGETKRNF